MGSTADVGLIRYLIFILVVVGLSCSGSATVAANQLLVSSDQTGNWEIYSLSLDSSLVFQMTRDPGHEDRKSVV